MVFRYGGPIEKTAATSMYWKEDTKNSAVFSKLNVSSLSLPESCTGGSYLPNVTLFKTRELPCTDLPPLIPRPIECPYLHATCYYYLADYACKHLFRHKISSR